MKDVLIIFMILLVLLMLISTFGGSIRPTERFFQDRVMQEDSLYNMPPPPPPPQPSYIPPPPPSVMQEQSSYTMQMPPPPPQQQRSQMQEMFTNDYKKHHGMPDHPAPEHHEAFENYKMQKSSVPEGMPSSLNNDTIEPFDNADLYASLNN